MRKKGRSQVTEYSYYSRLGEGWVRIFLGGIGASLAALLCGASNYGRVYFIGRTPGLVRLLLRLMSVDCIIIPRQCKDISFLRALDEIKRDNKEDILLLSPRSDRTRVLVEAELHQLENSFLVDL
jgi:hypothetical protein